MGKLVLVPTPLGNLGDITERAKVALVEADLVLAEDTRTTRRLLTALEIAAPELIALHAHNEVAIAARGATIPQNTLLSFMRFSLRS
jgi:16S rRNA (cytidine1402-2'-O)-methyltransferase